MANLRQALLPRPGGFYGNRLLPREPSSPLAKEKQAPRQRHPRLGLSSIMKISSPLWDFGSPAFHI